MAEEQQEAKKPGKLRVIFGTVNGAFLGLVGGTYVALGDRVKRLDAAKEVVDNSLSFEAFVSASGGREDKISAVKDAWAGIVGEKFRSLSDTYADTTFGPSTVSEDRASESALINALSKDQKTWVSHVPGGYGTIIGAATATTAAISYVAAKSKAKRRASKAEGAEPNFAGDELQRRTESAEAGQEPGRGK